MKIGIIGAGRMAQAIAQLSLRAGHECMISNSRGPQTLNAIAEAVGCEKGTVETAADFGDLVVAALHLQQFRAIPPEQTKGKVVLNPQNYFPQFGAMSELDSGAWTTAEILANHLPQSNVVKAVNSILVEDLIPDARPQGSPDRRALPIAGDCDLSKKETKRFLSDIGYDCVDAGKLSDGWRFERYRPVYCVSLNATELNAALQETKRNSFVPDGHWRSV